MDQKGSKLSKLSNLRICRGECPFQCFHKNNRNESRIKRWLIHSIMLCASKNGRLILQDKNDRLIGNLTVRRTRCVRGQSKSESEVSGNLATEFTQDTDSDNRVRPAFSYRSVNCSEYPRDIKFKLSTTRCLGANFISSTQRLRGLFRFFRIRLFETLIIQNMKFSVRINIETLFLHE